MESLKHSSLELIKQLYKEMYRYALKHNIVNIDYSMYVEIRKEDDDEKGVPFTEEDLKKLWRSDLEAAKIAVILCYSGWKIEEFVRVKIDYEDNVFRGGLKTEAGKNRIVPIHPSISPLLSDYSTHPIKSQQTYRKSLYKALDALGMEKRTPHNCRHTFSWLCDKYGVDSLSKKMMLGHSLGADVTEAVYGHRTVAQLREEICKIKCY